MTTRPSLSSKIANKALTCYGIALLMTAAALLVRRALTPVFGNDVPYITLFPAVAFCAWYCGVGPSVLSTILGLIGVRYWFIAPVHSLRLESRAAAVGILMFLLCTVALVLMGEARRQREQTLWEAQGSLEVAVKDRTEELDRMNCDLRELSARLLQLQDDERRRIARELHDSVGQMLTALGLNLASVGADIERLTKAASTVKDSAALVQELSQEVRTISHLLHPPLLDEAGLASALRWYVEGFAQRSKIEIALELPKDLGRLSRETETAVFRTVQECLTNIHRHSESPTAAVRVETSENFLRVQVEDRGKGISQEQQFAMAATGVAGVGIRGMRERLRQLGGSLDVRSDGKGTRVVAQLPIEESDSSDAVMALQAS